LCKSWDVKYLLRTGLAFGEKIGHKKRAKAKSPDPLDIVATI